MRRLLFLLLSLCVGGVALADSVELDRTVLSGGDTEGEDLLTVHFIDVGGGDGILIDTPSDKKILIDGGWSYADRGLARREYQAYLENFLEDDVIDLVIVTHPDYDHFAGLSNVLDNYVVRQIWYTGYDSNALSASWSNFMDKVQETEGLIFLSPLEDYIGPGSVIRFDDSETYDKSDDVVLTIINTRQWISDRVYGGERTLRENQRRNSTSLVVRLDYGQTSFLLTGDTNGREKGADEDACDDQELFMVRNNDNPNNPVYGLLDCTVLKVPHHGSDGSSSLRFLKAIKPEWAVVSAGVHYGHPTVSVLERLKHADVGLDDEHILCTDEGEDADSQATEENLGDDCYQFIVDPEGIVRIEDWKVTVVE